jgi:hypothetical protein
LNPTLTGIGFAGDRKADHLQCSRQVEVSSVAAIVALHRVLFSPSSLVLLISPSLRQSSELFPKVTDFVNLLPSRPNLVEENKLSLQIENGGRLASLPVDEANMRGYSNVSLIIEDEASGVSDYLYYVVRPMLSVSAGRLILLSTPFGRGGISSSNGRMGGLV